jgi:glycosyltransferase involved in cell wall biosynthesis
MISHERTGLLFPNGDQAALVTALAGLLTDRSRATGLGLAGQAHVRTHFSLERMAAEYETHYRQLLAAH